MKRDEIHTMVGLFKTLANESRLKILGILSTRECSVEELATFLKLTEPTVSHHLSRLKEVELVEMDVEGNTHLYRFNSKGLRKVNKDAFTLRNMAAFAGDVEFESWENKVLKNFMVGDRIKDLPASRKKRLVVLQWLLEKFQRGKNYPEKEVNEIIKDYHPDYATIRREFIINKLMKRESGVYWRID